MSDRIAKIDIDALQHNYRQVKLLAPNSQIIAMVKSNGYGHGLVRVARALQSADALGVSIVDEAAELRESGIKTDVVVMTGVVTSQELALAQEQHVGLVVHCHEQLELLEKTKCQRPLTCWLKYDTGMHRLGFDSSEIVSAYQRLRQSNWAEGQIHLMTHLANADDPSDPYTNQQLIQFKKMQQQLQLPGTIANSGGLIAWPESHYQWVRPGIMLYGISPLRGKTGELHGLKPVMTLKSRLIAIRHCKAGENVSYRGDWRCSEDMLVGVVAFGYGDGYPLHAKSGTPILINGIECPLVGRVCMDMLMVDLRHCPGAKVGDEVTLWGKGLPVEVVAQHADTIAYELICQLSLRVGFVE